VLSLGVLPCSASKASPLNLAIIRAERAVESSQQASQRVKWQWIVLLLLSGFLLGTLANYLLFTRLIRNDLTALRERVHAPQPVVPPTLLLPKIPRKSKR
jgi:hypothetical protein